MSDINEVIFDLTSLRDGPWDLTQVDRSALTEAIALLERSAGVWVPVSSVTDFTDYSVICCRGGEEQHFFFDGMIYRPEGDNRHHKTAHWEDDEWAMTVEHIDVTHVCKLKPPGEPK